MRNPVVDGDAFWQALGSVSSAVAAIAAFLAVRVSARQLSAQSEPKLYISPARFQIRNIGFVDEPLGWERPSPDAQYINGGSFDYYLELHNFGHGPALGVEVELEYDEETIYEIISPLLNAFDPPIEIVMDDWGTSVRRGGQTIGGFISRDRSKTAISYVPAARDAPSTSKVLIDPTLKYFLLSYARWYSETGRLKEELFFSVPVVLRIRFSTVTGKEVTSRQSGQFSVAGGRNKADKSDGVSIIDFDTKQT